MNDKFYVNSLYVSNFKPFVFMNPPQKIFFSDASKKIVKFMMLSGFNGYGKTSIFQSIEFALSGKVKIFEFKDTTNKYTEHITVNELDKESLVALELYNAYKKKYISIIRYNSKVKACKESDCKKEFKDYKLYILHEEFDYESFLDKLVKNEIKPQDTNEVANTLTEANIDEWLNSNYIKQEQSSNIIFKTNIERVNFVNQFIDKGYEQYFYQFQQEEGNIQGDIKQLKDDLKTLKSAIKINKSKSIGEEPKNDIIFKGKNVIWDKMGYDVDEDIEMYLEKVNSLQEFTKNIKIYDMTDRSDGIKKITNQQKLLKEIVIYSFYQKLMDSYIENYEKSIYLNNLIIDRNSIMSYELKSKYLSDKLLERIRTLRSNNGNLEKLSGNKEKIYTRTKELRECVIDDMESFSSVFFNTCPLCGHDYGDEQITLQDSIINYSNIFGECSNILNDSIKVLANSIDKDYGAIKGEIVEIIENIQCEKAIYEYLCDIKNNIVAFRKYKDRLEFLLNEDISKKFMSPSNLIDSNFIDSATVYILERLQLNKLECDSFIEKYYDDTFNNSIYEENKVYLDFIRNEDKESFISNIEMKKQFLKWLLSKKQFEKLSKDQLEFNKKYEQYKNLLIREKKLEKILGCVKRAKNLYMSDIIRYIEIPLYIYSGKLMQTHQCGLGVFCTTGPSEDKVTQFKLTTNGDMSGHDIINKFSSGQKAVINIALMLAFKKIKRYAFDLFMIDDPCQSMDDISIASLTEILKNEFKDSQILISTHDDNIAGYMCYKYKKSGNTCKNFNVQKELYNKDVIID